MTRNTQHDRNPSMRRRSAGAAAVAVLSFVGLSAVGDDHTEAAARTESATIADTAAEAASALDRWEATLDPADYVRFVRYRDQAATMAEADTELDDGALRDAWARAPLAKQEVVLNAVSQLGVPYRSLASEPGVGFDCSGLTIWAFREAGVELPRVSGDQIRAADSVDRDDATAGDLAYYPGHISIYLGADMMVHSPNSGNHVEIRPLANRSLRFGDAASDAASPVVDTFAGVR